MDIQYTKGFLDDMDRLFSWKWAPFRWLEKIKDIPREIKYIYQRATRGWCTRDVWGFDRYLAEVIVGGLTHMKKHHCGLPMAFCGEMKMRENGQWYHTTPDDEASKAWEDCLQEMIDGFGSKEKIDELENPDFSDPVAKAAWHAEIERLQAKQTRALALLSEHFDSLWD